MASVHDPSKAFFCTSCCFDLSSISSDHDFQRQHYKSDLHRYNLMRKIAELPPVSPSIFTEKVHSSQYKDVGGECTLCNKVFGTKSAMEAHLRSNKHLKKKGVNKSVKVNGRDTPESMISSTFSLGEPIRDDEVLSLSEVAEEEDSIANETRSNGQQQNPAQSDLESLSSSANTKDRSKHCLFCPLSFGEVTENITHMSDIHSFYLPERDYIVDLPGLINYLAQKLVEAHMCLSCHQPFSSIHGVQRHIKDKGHFSVAYQTEMDQVEIGDYYDFTSSYPTPKVRKSDSAIDDHDNDEDWEDEDDQDLGSASDDDDDDDDSLGSEDLGRLTVDPESRELRGSNVAYGHRNHRIFFRQNLRHSSISEGGANIRKAITHKVTPLQAARATSVAGVSGAALKRNEQKYRFEQKRRQDEFKTAVGFRQNSQKHYRDPLLQ